MKKQKKVQKNHTGSSSRLAGRYKAIKSYATIIH
jgi:hypothetical protein